MRYQSLRAVGLSALVILAGASSSFAASSASCKPVVTNRSGGYTTICAELCLCLDAADINALAQMNPNMDPIIFDTELPVPLTENDPIDDDELSAFASGEYEIPLSHFQPPFTICPPVSCAIIPGSCVTEPDGNYGGEDPAEWEYFEDGPPSPRPTVQIPGGSTIPVYFPENED